MTPYYERSEWPAFLAAIRAAPDDDLPRLVAADFVEENGDAERAEFIRVQVEVERVASELETLRAKNANHIDVQTRLIQLRQRQRVLLHADVTHQRGSGYKWSRWESWLGADRVQCPDGYNWFSRGFVTRVSAPLAVLSGGGCLRCSPRRRMARQIEQSEGWALGYPASGLADDLMALYDQCPNCVDGRTPGVLGELLRREPITAAGVEVTDATPIMDSGLWFWGKLGNTSLTHAHWLPDAVWQMAYVVSQGKLPGPGDRYVAFTSEPAARLALGEALYRLHGPKSEVLT